MAVVTESFYIPSKVDGLQLSVMITTIHNTDTVT